MTGGGNPSVKPQRQLARQLHFADTDPSVGWRLLQRQKKRKSEELDKELKVLAKP